MNNSTRRLLSGLLTATALAGCGDGRAKPVPVTGEVTFNGQPIEGARVMFIPGKARPGVGTTDKAGRFTLLTWAPEDGAIVGEHVVCVAKSQLVKSKSSDSPYADAIQLLPEKYMSPIKSPLRATVTAEGPNQFKFELVD